jgi:hypothetical protein
VASPPARVIQVTDCYDNDGDLVTAAAALDSEVDIDAGGFIDATNEAAEVGTSGVYKLLLTAAEMTGDIISTITKTSTTDAKTAVNVMYTATRQLLDLAFPTVSGRSLDVTAAGEAGIDLDNAVGALGTVQFDAAFFTAALYAAGAINAAAIATDAIGAAELAADAVAEIADAVLDEDMTAHQTLGTLGQAIGDPVADTTTIYQSVVTDAAGVNIAADIVAIEGQTDDIGVAGAGLTAIPWNAAWDAEVESEVNDALDTAIAELSQAIPTATPTVRTALMLLYMALRNRLDIDTTGASDFKEIYNDAGTVITKKTLTDDGATYSEAEMVAGP